MLFRRVSRQTTEWIEHSGKALLVDGARQVGKTYIIRECLKKSGKDWMELNLIDNPDFIQALKGSASAEELSLNLSALIGRAPKKNETIIFIDEIQEYKDIVTRIKFLVDEGSFRYVLSGSLLGVELNNLRSAPVGYVHEIKMYPMDFEEFLIASGVTEDIIENIRECCRKRIPVSDLIHQTLMKHFNRYLVIGGMPEAVRIYVESGNVNEVTEVQRDILTFYRRDFTKYDTGKNSLMINSIYENVPSQLLKQNRRFNYADIKKGLRFERVENTFLWLYSAGVVLSAFNTTEPKMPLRMNAKSNLVKLYYSDVGLLTCTYGNALRRDILFGNNNSNMGGVYENVVIQQLNAHGYNVYYYNSKKLGELDFVIEHEGEVVPIEVKSGKDYYVHSAITNVLEVKDFSINEAIVFSNYNASVDNRVTYLPIYMSAFLEPEVDLPVCLPTDMQIG